MLRAHPRESYFRLLSATLLMTVLAQHGATQTASSTLTTLYSFLGPPDDGGYPVAGLLAGEDGTLYGTTGQGGPTGDGTVYELRPPASQGGSWAETVIHSFAGTDGSLVFAGVAGRNGKIYGATVYGGTVGKGTIFELTPPATAGGAWTEAVIHNFTGKGDGDQPSGTLIVGKNGALYGTAFRGGVFDFGTVFELTPPATAGRSWTLTVLYTFTNTGDGGCPTASVTMSASGALYGLASGTAFELTPPASAGSPWVESTIATNLVSAPQAGLALGAGGVLYGSTLLGGENDKGSVFELTPPATPGGAWTQAEIYSFRQGSHAGGFNPYATLLIGKSGQIYGITNAGGVSGMGTIFELLPPASPDQSWTEKVLQNFTSADGGRPQGWLIERNGALYGTAYLGGGSGQGTVFKLAF